MKEIELGNCDERMLVDDEDYPLIARHSWFRHRCGYAKGPKDVLAHKLIFPVPAPKQVDHKNGNKLDNRKENLRACYAWENVAASRRSQGSSSQFLGVSFKPTGLGLSPWEANIKVKGKTYFLGKFATEIEAAIAYDEASAEHRGEFAPPRNIPLVEQAK